MAKLQQPLLLNLPQEDFGEMEPSEPSSPSRFPRLRGRAPVADTSSAGSPPASPVARMNMRTFLQGLTTERGPLSSALLDFATSAREEELLSSAFRSPVGEFLHRDRGQEVHEVHFEESDVEKGVDQDIEPGLTGSSTPSASTAGTCGAGAPQAPEMESQETDYTIHVADSCASTEGSSIVQDSRVPTKQSPRTSDLSRHCLNIIDESKEWGEMSSTLDDDSRDRASRSRDEKAEKGGRSPRAAQIEVNSGASVNHIDPNLVRCGNWCLFFLEMWISTGCILLCAFRKDWCLCFLLALPHALLVGIEVQLIGRDWAFRRNLHALQGSSRGKAMFFKSIVFLIFGCLSCLPVMRARQCWKQRGMRASLVDEIETPAGEGLHESARFDSHVMFVTNVPRIIVLLYASTSLVYTELELSVLLSMAFLSLLNVLQAAVNFDYYASKWIRAQYETLTSEGFPFQFQVLHYAYRLCEIALRILTLLLVTEALRFHVWVAVLYLCLDYLLSTAALCFVTAKQAPGSRLVLILSVSIYVFDCCRFIDEQGLTRQARQVSNLLRALRSGQSAVVLPLLWWIHPERSSSWFSKIFWPTWALLLGLLALVWLLEKCTRLQHRAVDIFMACKKGLLQEVVDLLDSGCDCNLRLVDDGSTPLHVAAGCGQSECVEVLLRRGADPLLSDVDGETPLHKACRHGHARCIRVLLHPPVDAPCVLRGDFLECAAQVNQLGQRPLQLLEAVEKSCKLVDELAEFQHQPDLKRSLSSQMSQLSPTRSISGELHGAAQSVFGEVLKNSESRFLVASKHVGTSRSLTGFLFTTGIGEQMAEVLDNEAPAESPQLTTLRTQGVLGAGAFGKVFKVLDVCSSEVYALKLQRRDSTTKFAIREAEALHRSSHAFIVRLIHIFQTQSYYALLMELCDKSLNACILDSLDENGQIGGLADYPTKRYAACITLALEYLHQQRVVFRDLKPDNVLVTFKDNVAKLADFGLARSLTLDSAVEARGSEESGSDKLSLSPKVSSTVCGTPRFMAPEVYDELMLVDSDDEEDAIKRLLSRDWYALGCCLLLMLLGQEAGSLAEANGRRVLLPPSGQAEITCSLRKASKKGRIDEDALHLIDSLTAPVEVRFDASDLRRQPFLEQVIVEMEQFASA